MYLSDQDQANAIAERMAQISQEFEPLKNVTFKFLNLIQNQFHSFHT